MNSETKHTPSALASKIALHVYPNGLPWVHYQLGSHEANQAEMQRDRDVKALGIDAVLQPEHAALLELLESAKEAALLTVSLCDEVGIEALKSTNCYAANKALLSKLAALK